MQVEAHFHDGPMAGVVLALPEAMQNYVAKTGPGWKFIPSQEMPDGTVTLERSELVSKDLVYALASIESAPTETFVDNGMVLKSVVVGPPIANYYFSYETKEVSGKAYATATPFSVPKLPSYIEWGKGSGKTQWMASALVDAKVVTSGDTFKVSFGDISLA